MCFINAFTRSFGLSTLAVYQQLFKQRSLSQLQVPSCRARARQLDKLTAPLLATAGHRGCTQKPEQRQLVWYHAIYISDAVGGQAKLHCTRRDSIRASLIQFPL
ncbi:hypothetical protein MPTK1_5g09310 [Marchantia polymorpha subsp. ruderalis]|uniref:Uncharacterized protein n=2 Tax=Marchantia polymorpha TaxID=3197 RepID=A0AAF6BGJ7_MARPO|nr:hypothetical protein MARPO_0095s0029 [Marchantia polymorpha]BBN11131.1 hypothetical protein Mp_5g09310 [Marchantia polymorpha subsp. ruderalis]|eukprot:PTQ32767.1 hypothetical protein MARPO_0095s0029 [Marchantia polymorpha]